MIFDQKEYEFVLTSGKRFYANMGIIGLRDSDQTLYQGYDGTGPDFEHLTPEERAEIRDYMLVRWRVWAEPDRPHTADPATLRCWCGLLAGAHQIAETIVTDEP